MKQMNNMTEADAKRMGSQLQHGNFSSLATPKVKKGKGKGKGNFRF